MRPFLPLPEAPLHPRPGMMSLVRGLRAGQTVFFWRGPSQAQVSFHLPGGRMMSLLREQWSLYGPQRGPRLGRRAGASGVTGRVGTKDLAAPQGAAGLLLIPLPPKWGVLIFHVENTGT